MVQNTTKSGESFKTKFKTDGVFGIGRQPVGSVAGSTNFITRAVEAGLLQSTTWAY
jgi:hypothetical protein